MVFEHSSAPASIKPTGGTQKKYRDDETPLPLSSDPRVVRGSTTALMRKVTMSRKNTTKLMSRTLDEADFDRQLPRPTYKFDVRGHVGPDIDLSSYLIAAEDGVATKKKEVTSQTDSFKDRPPTPEYQPRKTGIDGQTQVEDVRELFDFDAESDPIVNVIVSKTLEQALFEVQHEEEMTALENVAGQFHETIEAEKAWTRAREKETIQELQEHRGEMFVANRRAAETTRVTNLVAGGACMRQILPGVFENAVEDLYNDKTWRRPERATVEENTINVARDKLRIQYKSNFECKRLIEELMEDVNKLYEEKTHTVKKAKDDRMINLLVRPKREVPTEGEDAPPPPKDIEPVKLWGGVSMMDVIKEVKKLCEEAEIPPYELTVAMLTDYFEAKVGRTIARDGAIMNFQSYLPDDEMVLEIG